MYRVHPHQLWIGNAGDGRDYRVLYEHEVRAVVQLAVEEPPLDAPREFLLFRIPLLDGEGNDGHILQLAIETVARLLELEIPTLVCCSGGMSRSPCVVGAALCLRDGGSFDEHVVQITQNHPADLSPGLCEEIRLIVDS